MASYQNMWDNPADVISHGYSAKEILIIINNSIISSSVLDNQK